MLFSVSSRKGCFLFLLSILSSLLLSSQSCTALATPAGDFETVIVPHDRDVPTMEDVEQLVKPENVLKFERWASDGQPPKDKAVYYSGQKTQMTNKILNWAKNQGFTSIRDIWKSQNFRDRRQYKGIADDTWRKYQEIFSSFYAIRTEGKAYLIFPHGQKPKGKSIFWQFELTELINQNKVEQIVWINQNRLDDKTYKWQEEKTTYWKKGDPKPPHDLNSTTMETETVAPVDDFVEVVGKARCTSRAQKELVWGRRGLC
ncbi:hypothetical protein TOPH_05397 [Tolypocladium ophioglossoides CBS 100239]|uniref:Uncharacterized protein n=1 Tax=Tolypocladium ophioglossoides (strain CBS 100239) TaxID=1163406 RepID=A0A0L0N7C4_TOLOC|nr:hypothetical protein TOPH_05397 [Tolypocladium ophioglossoides CBS 100239]